MNHSSNSFPRRTSFILLAAVAAVITSAALDTRAQTPPKGKDPFQKISFEGKRSCTIEVSSDVTALVKNGVELSAAEDFDCDGIADAFDNCVGMPNPTQADTNGNGIGDTCEAATVVKTSLPAKPISKEKPKESKSKAKAKAESRSKIKPERKSKAKAESRSKSKSDRRSPSKPKKQRKSR